MRTDHDAAGSSTEERLVGRVNMDAAGETGQSPGASLLVSVLFFLLMIGALIFIFHNAFRLG